MTKAQKEKILANILLFVLIIIVLVSVCRIYFFNADTTQAETCEIYKDGELIQTVSLTELTEPVYIEIGDSNTVMLDSHGAMMHYANCPDKLCVKQGKITSSQSVVCLPNRVSVHVTGKKTSDLDGITG